MGKQTGKHSSITLPFVNLEPMSQSSCPHKNDETRVGVDPTTKKMCPKLSKKLAKNSYMSKK